ncbi:hypothetical protein ANN_18520 [Periplaneta americana]|uniref:Reverse transcriptase domain-containing protein n=1 Tax=Periplaneta americana TaxID=6978 RepID=A0ABQ8SR28_PERAM|nr:hypothetical protein ANN_18520 [Periplaneta americana]
MFQMSVEDIQRALNGMKTNSAAGPDRVLIRTLKLIDCASVISRILKIMVNWNIVPDGMRDARTILIFDGCLRQAKQDKKYLNIFMLDITQTFDNEGFEYLEQTLNTQPLPTCLRELIKTLTKENFTIIHSSGSKSDRIKLKRGGFQGSPLSPLLFNLSIDFIIKKLTEKHVIVQYGFQINSDLDSLTISAFADDLVVVSKSMNAAQVR